MVFKPFQDGFVLAGFYFPGPIKLVVIVPDQARHTDSDAVLCPADDAVAALGVVLEAENEFGEHFRVHVGQFHRPDFLDHVACRGGEAATLAHLKSRLQRDGDGPSRSETRNVGLVNPSAGEVQTSRNLAEVMLQSR